MSVERRIDSIISDYSAEIAGMEFAELGKMGKGVMHFTCNLKSPVFLKGERTQRFRVRVKGRKMGRVDEHFLMEISTSFWPVYEAAQNDDADVEIDILSLPQARTIDAKLEKLSGREVSFSISALRMLPDANRIKIGKDLIPLIDAELNVQIRSRSDVIAAAKRTPAFIDQTLEALSQLVDDRPY